jgi:DNA-binding NarL/FixJ family response regulator
MKQIAAGPEALAGGEQRQDVNVGLHACDPRLFQPVAPKAPFRARPTAQSEEIRYWKQRLMRRLPGSSTRACPRLEFSVRIEHGKAGYVFPLGTEAEEEAALRARDIYRRVLAKGWAGVLREYPREVTLAIFWGENPMVFTYTTLCTVPEHPAMPNPPLPTPCPQRPSVALAILESESPSRRALAEWVQGLPGFVCRGLFSTRAEALQALKRSSVDLVLVNRQLAGLRADEFVRTLRDGSPHVPALGYRVYNNSDELFVSQPRVSGGYFFRRRPPQDLLEPIRDVWNHGPPAPAEWDVRIYAYFQRLLLSHTAPGDCEAPLLLTLRQQEILGCLSRGVPDKEIACALQISAWTVHTHLKRIYEKLGVHSRAEAIVKFLQGWPPRAAVPNRDREREGPQRPRARSRL